MKGTASNRVSNLESSRKSAGSKVFASDASRPGGPVEGAVSTCNIAACRPRTIISSMRGF